MTPLQVAKEALEMIDDKGARRVAERPDCEAAAANDVAADLARLTMANRNLVRAFIDSCAQPPAADRVETTPAETVSYDVIAQAGRVLTGSAKFPPAAEPLPIPVLPIDHEDDAVVDRTLSKARSGSVGLPRCCKCHSAAMIGSVFCTFRGTFRGPENGDER